MISLYIGLNVVPIKIKNDFPSYATSIQIVHVWSITLSIHPLIRRDPQA